MPSQRRALGALFVLLAFGFAGIAAAAIASGSGARAWVVGLAAAAIGLWLAGLAFRALR
jgi:1,4-dihydroxy-2-naphthoate octaprenyltransferase